MKEPFMRTAFVHFDWSQKYDTLLNALEAEGEISEDTEISPSASRIRQAKVFMAPVEMTTSILYQFWK